MRANTTVENRPAWKPKSILRKIGRGIRWLAQSKKMIIGAVMLAIIVIIVLLAPLLAPYSPYQMQLGKPIEKPSGAFLLGTDSFGRDVLSRLLYGGRISLGIASTIMLLSVLIGTLYGLICGYWGGKVDLILMRVVDIIFSLPWILLSLCIAAIAGTGVHVIFWSLGLIYTAEIAKLVRGVSLSVREKEYIEAAVVTCEPSHSIIFRFLLPNCVAPIIIQGSLIMSAAILGEAAISYLGLGVQSPDASWGVLLSDSGDYIFRSLAQCIAPGIAIMLSVLAINLLGDGLRDVLDPRFVPVRRRGLRNARGKRFARHGAEGVL